jgi:hypothetical protein
MEWWSNGVVAIGYFSLCAGLFVYPRFLLLLGSQVRPQVD